MGGCFDSLWAFTGPREVGIWSEGELASSESETVTACDMASRERG